MVCSSCFRAAGVGWQSVRNWGMWGFDNSGWLKSWMTRQAMGVPAGVSDRVGPPGPAHVTGPT